MKISHFIVPKQIQATPLYNGAHAILKTLHQNGFIAYWAGGAVRDLLMGNFPDDIDIATSATPDDIERIFRNTIAVGKQFGIIIVVNNKISYEVATFRQDGNYQDGRRPDSVAYSNAENDAKRRDFTINGLFYDPDYQQIIDYVGGEKDIQNKIIRTIGSPQNRFSEDKLRLLRAIRFAVRFSFQIADETFATIQNMASEINIVSRERIRQELEKMISQIQPPFYQFNRMAEILFQTNIFQNIFPEFESAEKKINWPALQKLIQWQLNNYQKIITQCWPEKTKAEPLIFFAMILHLFQLNHFIYSEKELIDDKIETESFSSLLKNEPDLIKIENKLIDLKFSNKEKKAILSLCKDKKIFDNFFNLPDNQKKKIARDDLFLEKLIFYFSLDEYSEIKKNQIQSILQYKQREEQAQTLWPIPLITGNDLKAMGVQAGPRYKDLLLLIEDAQLNGEIHSYDEAKELILEQLPR